MFFYKGKKRLDSGNLCIAPPYLVIIGALTTCFFLLFFDKGKKRLVSGNLGIAPPYLVIISALKSGCPLFIGILD